MEAAKVEAVYTAHLATFGNSHALVHIPHTQGDARATADSFENGSCKRPTNSVESTCARHDAHFYSGCINLFDVRNNQQLDIKWHT